MKYGLVLPLWGIERAIEQLVEYAHIAKEAGREWVFLEDYVVYWGAYPVLYSQEAYHNDYVGFKHSDI